MITFDKSASDFILETFNKITDKDGYVVEKENTEQKVLTPDGLEMQQEEFGGIKKGSEIYIKSDLPSVIKLSDNLKSANGTSS